MVLDVGIFALLSGVTVLTVIVWITHRDMEKLRRDFLADRALMKRAIASLENAVNACHRLAEAVVTLARKQPPGPGPSE
jgi:hypothetical protein